MNPQQNPLLAAYNLSAQQSGNPADPATQAALSAAMPALNSFMIPQVDPQSAQKQAQLQQDRNTMGNFINSIVDTSNPNSLSNKMGNYLTEAGLAGSKFITHPGQFLSNAATNAGDVVQGIVSLPKTIGGVVMHPETAGDVATRMIKGVGTNVNNLVGQPINPQTGALQIPSLAEAETNFYNRPIDAVMSAQLLKGGLNAASNLYGKFNPGEAEEAATEAPTAPKSNFLTKKGAAMQNDITKIRLDPSVYGAEKEAAVNETINNDVPGVTAADKYQNLQPTMDKFGQEIQADLTNNPKSVSISQIKQDFMDNLKGAGVMRRGEITVPGAEKAVSDYIDNINEQANPTMSDTISNADLYNNVRPIVQNDFKAVYKKILNGSTLTPTDQVILQAKQTLDDVIAENNPAVDNLITKQSHLFDAASSLEAARDASSPPTTILGTTIPSGVVTKAKGAIGKGLEAVGNTGLPAIGGNVLKAAVVGSLLSSNGEGGVEGSTPSLEGSQAGQSPQYAVDPVTGKISIPTTFQDNKPGAAGQYTVPNPYATGDALSDQDYVNQKSQLLQQAQLPQNQVFPNSQRIQSQLTDLENKHAISNNIKQPYQDTLRLTRLANDAYSQINQAPPNLLSLYPTFDTLRQAADGKYARLADELQTLEQQSGLPKGSLFKAQTKDVALSNLDFAQKNIQNNFNAVLSTYLSPSSQNQPIQNTNPYTGSAQSINLPPIQGSQGAVQVTAPNQSLQLQPLPGGGGAGLPPIKPLTPEEIEYRLKQGGTKKPLEGAKKEDSYDSNRKVKRDMRFKNFTPRKGQGGGDPQALAPSSSIGDYYNQLDQVENKVDKPKNSNPVPSKPDFVKNILNSIGEGAQNVSNEAINGGRNVINFARSVL